ncbi:MULTISPECIES: nucleotidyltransferase family protein [Methylobacterium]|jgi:molybdenum cofactor cytidylyltransferase|uniref:Nicotine blue oxidoreductase n=1 Tax=Methylobacterium hispanicum TaxID=270350 RepID=A0AAV4ZID5_9HYPH|nr:MULTISPECIES: nucleotidyltransferase family protein [Methylobacterium]GJD88234.1 Nicotine blue oxidoreductase [Methylobacterium hispanicum]
MPEPGPAFPPGIGIVLLAAGRGTRFGPEPKLLAALGGRPLVRHAAEAACEAACAWGLGPVVAVLGAHAPAVRAALSGLDIRFVENPAYADGLSTSLRAGLAALPEACPGAVVMLGDMPRVAPALLRRLAEAFDGRAAAIVPVWQGRRGNPVLLNHRRLAPELDGLAGDRGAGPLLAGRPDVVEIAGEAGSGLDIDTPEALAAL